MQEMDAQPINICAELAKTVEPRLSGAPIVSIPPIGAQRLRISQPNTLPGISNRFTLGPAGVFEAGPQIGQHGVGNGQIECLDIACHAALLLRVFTRALTGVTAVS